MKSSGCGKSSAFNIAASNCLISVHYALNSILQVLASEVQKSALLQLHRFEFGEDVADENVCLDPQRDAFVVIR